MSTTIVATRWAGCFLVLVFASWAFALAMDQDSPSSGKDHDEPIGIESARTLDGRRVAGRLLGDESAGFRFEPGDGSEAIPLAEISRVDVERSAIVPGPGDVPPPFLVDLGLGRRLSGVLDLVSEDSIRLTDTPEGRSVTIARGGAIALRQRPGELQVLRETFERLDATRWRSLGRPELVDEPRLEGEQALRLPAGSASLTHPLQAPIHSGRFDLAFFQEEETTAGQRWFVDLLFHGPFGDEALQVVLGWSEVSPGVVSRGGPTLATQPLTPDPGWHRLSVQFGPGRTLLAIDGDELAHGAGPNGPLIEIRLATESVRGERAPDDLAAYIDDLRIVRFAEPSSNLEVDPTQDEVRLNQGDQLFGSLRSADAEELVLEVNGRQVPLSWSEVSGIYFERSPTTSEAVEGLLVRLDWRAGPGRDLDRIDGALIEAGEAALTIDTAYAGRLKIPRDRLQRLEVLGQARRIVLDPYARHLGDQFMPELDPPFHESDRLELDFELDEVPSGTAALVLDVVEVEGEANGLRFVEELRRGELRTNVSINGQAVDYLNRHITTRNKAPERIRLEIPEGVLQTGSNRLLFEQTGTADEPLNRDDLGLLEIALEFTTDNAER